MPISLYTAALLGALCVAPALAARPPAGRPPASADRAASGVERAEVKKRRHSPARPARKSRPAPVRK